MLGQQIFIAGSISTVRSHLPRCFLPFTLERLNLFCKCAAPGHKRLSREKFMAESKAVVTSPALRAPDKISSETPALPSLLYPTQPWHHTLASYSAKSQGFKFLHFQKLWRGSSTECHPVSLLLHFPLSLHLVTHFRARFPNSAACFLFFLTFRSIS